MAHPQVELLHIEKSEPAETQTTNVHDSPVRRDSSRFQNPHPHLSVIDSEAADTYDTERSLHRGSRLSLSKKNSKRGSNLYNTSGSLSSSPSLVNTGSKGGSRFGSEFSANRDEYLDDRSIISGRSLTGSESDEDDSKSENELTLLGIRVRARDLHFKTMLKKTSQTVECFLLDRRCTSESFSILPLFTSQLPTFA